MSLFNNRINTYLILVMIMIGFCLSGCATESKLIKQGREYASAGNWDKSVELFQKAFDQNPDNHEVELLLFRAKKNASLAHLAKGETLLKTNRFEEAISEFQMSIAFDPANLDVESLIEKAMAMKESEYHFKKGESLAKAQKFTQAKEALQKALSLNPDNEKAHKALELINEKERHLPKYRLHVKTKEPISLKFKNTPILNVFEIITRLTGVNFIFDKDIQETKVTFFLTDVSFDQFLEIFLQTNKLAGKLINEKTMIIYPDTPQKAKEYEELQIRTFYLANMDVKKAVPLLSKILKSKDISANEEFNAVVVRGTKAEIEIASKIIEANDRPASEVMLNVEILEVKRSKERQIGLELNPTFATIGVGESTEGFFDASAEDAPAIGSFSLNVADKISKKNVLVSIPSATVNLLKRDGDTKTLASPQIRVKNKEKAKIHIGERIPLRSNRRVDVNGAITYDYQYQDVGIKLNVEPTINLHDDVSLNLTLEVSAIGENVGTTDDPQYSIRTRTAQSVMSVRAGESVIIGGLISDEERRTIRKVPLLGDVPILGYLFSNYDTDDSQTDILMTITPIMVRAQEIPSPEVAQIWSGRDQDFSLRKPYEGYYEDENTHPASPPSPNNKISPPPKSQEVPQPEPKIDRNEIKQDIRNKPKPEDAPPLQARNDPPQPNTAPKDTTGISSDSWPPSMNYTIHVNSFLNKADADIRVQQLRDLKFDSFTLPGHVSGENQAYYRVFVGKFKNFETASQLCNDLKQKSVFRKDIHVVSRSWALGG